MELFKAIATQNLVEVQSLIKKNPELLFRVSAPSDAPLLGTFNPPLLPGITPMMACAQYCFPRIGPDDDENAKVQKAYQARAVIEEVLSGVIKHNGDVNEIDVYQSRTALQWAVVLGNFAMINSLVDAAIAGKINLYCHLQDVNGVSAASLAKNSGFVKALDKINEVRLRDVGTGPVSMAIVGMGATGTALFIRLVREILERGTLSNDALKQVSFHLIDSKSTPGGGTAYSRELNSPTSLLNVAAKAMSIDSKDSDDFLRYIGSLREANKLAEALGEAGALGLINTKIVDPDGYYPRVFFGNYCTLRLNQWIERAKAAGISVSVHPQTLVTDVSKPTDGQVTLCMQEAPADGKADEHPTTLQVSHVFYATGHWEHKKRAPRPYEMAPGTIFYPVSRETLRERGVFHKPNNIAVMGSSLSAIDAVFAILLNPDVGTLAWDDQGVPTYIPKDPQNPFTVTCYSRRGAWPKVRPVSTPPLPGRSWTSPQDYEEFRRYLNSGQMPSLTQCIELLDNEMALAYGRPYQSTTTQADGKAPLKPVMQMFDPIKLFKPGEKRDPFKLLASDAHIAEFGDASSSPARTWVRWYAVLNGVLETMKRMYRNLTPEERTKFDRDLNTPFLWAFAPMPLVTAKVLLAMHKAGVLNLYRTAVEFPAFKDGKYIEWKYFDQNAKLDDSDTPLSASHDFMAVVAGLGSDMRQDASELTINQFASGEFTCVDPRLPVDPMTPGSHENTVFLRDDDSYELVNVSGNHSAIRRGVGFFAHGSIWSIQAVPMVVRHAGRAALIYVDEFEKRLKGKAKL